MSNCRKEQAVEACFTPNDGSPSVSILHTTLYDANGAAVGGYFHDREGNAVNEQTYIGGGVASIGSCVLAGVSCVESQEWTYGIDNTGTDYRWRDATYELELSDGTIWTWKQTTASNGGWSAQLTEWASENQTQADNAGVKFFVEPRFIDDLNVTNLDGTINGPGGTPSGLPGAPSEVIALALSDGGMSWRYVNFQVCPGQPVPVAARLIAVDDQGLGRTPPALPFDLTAAGPVLGPLQRFFVCRSCGEEPVWYLEDGVTRADSGQIPNCYEPCGVLSTLPPPPSSDCQFEITVACDNNNSQNTVDFTNTITRRAKICNGEQIAVDYFQADPDDASALVPYDLNGDFVDCATGEPVPVPPVSCESVSYAGQIWRLSDAVQEASVEWWAPPSFPGGSSNAPHGNVSDIFTVSDDGQTLVHVNGAPDVTFTQQSGSVATNSGAFVSAVGAASTAETNGTDQLKVYGYFVLSSNAMLRDTNPQTGERGGIWIDRCCAGGLELLSEDTTDSAPGDTGVFDGIRVPAGIHYFEAVTSDFSAWQGFQLSASLDGGDTYTPLEIYRTKPRYECITLMRCDDSGALIDRDTGDTVRVRDTDLNCQPPFCDPCGCPTVSQGDNGDDEDGFDGNVTDVTPNPDQTHEYVSGTGNVPAGLKTVTINNISGITRINGGFELGNGRRLDSISYSATEIDRARGLLPAFTLSGGTFQWTGLRPIAEA